MPSNKNVNELICPRCGHDRRGIERYVYEWQKEGWENMTIDEAIKEHDEEIYNKAIDDCLKILYFHQNEYDGIQWAIREIEELKEMERD